MLFTLRKITGFSLTEVLLGVGVTLVMLTFACVGLVNLMQSQAANAAEGEIEDILERVSTFIIWEIRKSPQLIPPGEETPPLPPDSQLVLTLAVPDSTNAIAYYTTPAKGIWQKARLLNRWGLPIDNQGEYILEIDPLTGAVDSSNWEHSILVDSLVDADHVPNKNCQSWKRLPAQEEVVDGFYVCLNERATLIRLRLSAQVPTQSKDKNILSKETKFFVRSTL
jgi:type II secretory pathway pseudopilin PulG